MIGVYGGTMKQIRTTLNITFKNWMTLFLFDIVYKAITYSLLYSITSDLLSLILRITGAPYLSAENLHLILLKPLALIPTFLLILLISLAAFFETSALYIYGEKGWKNESINIFELLRLAATKTGKVFNLKKALLFIAFVLTSVVSVLPFSPYIVKWLYMPEFIRDFMVQNRVILPIYITAIILANIFSFVYLFVLPGLLFNKNPHTNYLSDGFKKLRKNSPRIIFHFMVSFLVLAVVMLTIMFSLGLLLSIFIKATEPAAEVVPMFRLYYQRMVPAVHLVRSVITSIWFVSIVMIFYHELNEDIRPVLKSTKISLRYRLVRIALIFVAVIVLLIFSETELGGSFIHQSYSKPIVVAHRAGAEYAPENTIAAVKNSIKMGTDMVEIDVQQLKDGELILLHDDNFKRTAGVDSKVWEVDYSDIEKYDAGSWFSEDFAKEPIPRLEDVLTTAKNKIEVMIELKLTGHEDNLVEGVIELIEKYNMQDEACIGSLNLEVLKEVKRINPKIKTVYITPLISSGDYDLSFIDAFSVETTSISREMVLMMHLQKKEVYAWTANSKDTIRKNLRAQVNGIVTDNPTLVRYYSEQDWESKVMNFMISIFFGK